MTGSLNGVESLQPLQRLRLYEELERRLREYIRTKGLRPGDRLPAERDLATRLQVSRASVRQAVIVLEVEGIVEVRTGDGVYLKRRIDGNGESLRDLLKNEARLPEILEARATLECRLAELAAHRRTTNDLDAIHSALAKQRRDIEEGGLGVDGANAYHKAIGFAAHNEVLFQLYVTLTEPIAETRVAALGTPGRARRSLAGHERIASAIRNQDASEAGVAMRQHLSAFGDVVLHWRP